MSRQRIGLLDCNNFFASCERVFRPDLRQRPVVVLSSNDGCVIARSQEIKDKGIPMGVPYFQIKDSLKDMKATVFSSNFTLYRDFSARVTSLVRNRFRVVEQYSIDEVFFVVDDSDSEVEMLNLREQINREIGLPVSIGIGFSKTQAKYANQVSKKTTGYYAMQESTEAALLNLPLAEVWGVGSGLSRQLRERGLLKVDDLLEVSEQQLKDWFGVVVERLRMELSGRVCYPVTIESLPQKSYISSRSLSKPTTSRAVLQSALAFHVEQIVKDLWQGRQKATEIRLFLYPDRYGDYFLHGVSPGAVLTIPSRESSELQNIVNSLFEAHFDSQVPYKKVGVAVARLVSDDYTNASLFGNQDDQHVSDTVQEINRRLGEVLHVGVVPKSQSTFKTRQEHISPAYTTRWSDVCIVKAN